MKKKISILTLLALVAGCVFGLISKELPSNIAFIGTIYINILKFLIGPIIFTSVTVTAFSSVKNNNKLAGQSVLTFIIMFIVTFLISSLIIVLINPSKGFSFEAVEWNNVTTPTSVTDVIINLFPTNIVTMFANNQLFALILFSFLVGHCASKVTKGDKLIESVKTLRDIFYRILEYVMYMTPFAVFSLISNTISKYGIILFGTGVKYILTAYICGIVCVLVVMVLPVWLIAKKNPFKYVSEIYKVWLITLTTCSSAATLPTTMKICKDELGIPEEITDVVVPLGCTIHMCGGAVSFALLGIFCSNLYGIPINITQYVLMLASAVIINMSAPGIPNGGVVIGASYLQILGIPLDFIGFYSGIYKILDMLYTSLNVTGDITANILICNKAKATQQKKQLIN